MMLWLINKTNSVKSVKTKIKDLFVTRIDQTTTLDDFTKMVNFSIPDAVCEKLEAKYPDKYSSFRVSVNEDSFDVASKAEMWPEGALVTNFFRAKLQKK